MITRLTGKDRSDLAATIKAKVNAACVALYAEGPRSHLGASEIGRKCTRRLVYSFRWMAQERFDGRMLRLFNRGHREEDRIIEWLRAAGFAVFSHGTDGKQIRIFDGQHHGGSLDAVALLPPDLNLTMPFLAEFKTHNRNSFNKLLREGVKLSKPIHFSQMCEYGWHHKLQYAIYFAVNKDDDEIFIEIVELDFAHGAALADKAQKIVSAETLPGRIAGSAAHQECKYCPMVDICHNGQPANMNCRSCHFSRAIDNGEWFCNKWAVAIPKDRLPEGCPSWQEFGK